MPGSECMNRFATTRSDILIQPRLSILNYTRYIIASYCFQSLIGLANLLSAISCYKFYILKYLQVNMKVTIVCYLTTFLFIYIEQQRVTSFALKP